MLPPGEVNYYYSIDEDEPETRKLVVNDQELNTDVANLLHGAHPGSRLSNLKVTRVNVIQNIIQFNQPLTEAHLASVGCIPRAIPVVLKGRALQKDAWDFFKSVFKDYKPDSAKLLENCFEIDWENTKCEKIIKGDGEAAKTKEYIRTVYEYLRETYKYYAGVSPLGRVMSIGPGTMTELFHHCENFIDGKVIKISDIDLQLIAVNGGKRTNNYLSPDKAIIRSQFIEVLVRLSIDKYFKTKVCETPSEAIELAFETHFLPFFKSF